MMQPPLVINMHIPACSASDTSIFNLFAAGGLPSLETGVLEPLAVAKTGKESGKM